MPPKFSMDKCAKAAKRSLDDSPGSQKMPRAKDIAVDAVIPRTSPSSRAASAPIVICVYKWTGNAGDVLQEYADKNVGLYQIQIDQDCRNSVIVRWKSKFEAFLRASRENSASLPDNLEALAAVAGIHTVVAPGDNLRGGVFVPWRVALYAARSELFCSAHHAKRSA